MSAVDPNQPKIERDSATAHVSVTDSSAGHGTTPTHLMNATPPSSYEASPYVMMRRVTVNIDRSAVAQAINPNYYLFAALLIAALALAACLTIGLLGVSITMSPLVIAIITVVSLAMAVCLMLYIRGEFREVQAERAMLQPQHRWEVPPNLNTNNSGSQPPATGSQPIAQKDEESLYHPLPNFASKRPPDGSEANQPNYYYFPGKPISEKKPNTSSDLSDLNVRPPRNNYGPISPRITEESDQPIPRDLEESTPVGSVEEGTDQLYDVTIGSSQDATAVVQAILYHSITGDEAHS